MTKTELLEILLDGENSGVEFKLDAINNQKLAKELVAFSNLQGGRILLGVDDEGTVVGITRDNLEEWIMEACRSKIRPEIIPYYELFRDVEAGKHVAVVKVEPGWSVHHVWHNNHRTYYIRVGTTSREASPEELARLFQQRGAFRVEIRGVSGFSLADLDIRRLGDYFTRVREQSIPSAHDQAGWRTLLINTELVIQESDNYPTTVAAMLLFGQQPNRFLPQAGIDAVAYPGLEKGFLIPTVSSHGTRNTVAQRSASFASARSLKAF